MAKAKIKTKLGAKIKNKVPKKPIKKTQKCNICFKTFSDRQNMLTHRAIHDGKTFQCPICPFTTTTKKYLGRHHRQVHIADKKHKCTYCGKLFLHGASMRKHVLVHTGEKPHVCNECGKAFRAKYCLNMHMLIHRDVKPYKCSFCEYACRDTSTLRKHQNKHMGLESVYRCKMCHKTYKDKWKLKHHIAEKHFDVDMKKVPCERCGKFFHTVSKKNQHVKIVHLRAYTVKCPVCGFQLANGCNLDKHMRTHLDERPFACAHSGCKWAFKNKGDLSKHLKIHDPSQHLPCSFCDRKFVRKTHLQRHEQIMHLQRTKNVECDYCGSRFYTKNYLIKHIQIKHVLRHKFKYICDICGLKTYNKPSIVMHLKYGHSDDNSNDLSCKLCSNTRVYKRHMYLKMHYWRAHNVKYKITRSRRTKVEHTEEEIKPNLDIKVEPNDTKETEIYEEIQLMDIDKDEMGEDESIDYSKKVLSEDITALVLKDGKLVGKEIDFDEFYIKHKMDKQEEKPVTEPKEHENIDETKNQLVKSKIKQIIIRTQKLAKAKALRKKKKEEERLRREKEAEEARIAEEMERQEIVELRRVRDMYNERMQAALEREREKKVNKGKVNIKHFKKKPNGIDSTCNNDNNGDNKSLTDDNNESTADGDDDMPLNTYVTNNVTTTNDTSTDKEENVSNIEMEHDKLKRNYDINIENKNIDEEIVTKNKSVLSDNTNNLDYVEKVVSKETGTEDSNIILDKDLAPNNVEKHVDHNYIRIDERKHIEIANDNHDSDKCIVDNENEIQESIENTQNKSDISNPLTKSKDTYEIGSDITTNDNDYVNNNKGNIQEVLNTPIVNNNDTINKKQQSTNSILDDTLENNISSSNDKIINSPNNENTIEINKQQCSNIIIENDTQSNDSTDNENDKNDSDSDDDSDDKPLKRGKRNRKSRVKKLPKKMEFKTHQCYVCFKLYQTKEELINHCQEHFDICNIKTLAKCPICNDVTYKIAQHMQIKHKIKIKVPFNRIKDRKVSDDGSRYCYDIDGTEIELIPSVKLLNRTASIQIDKKRREDKDKGIAKSKLVRIGNSWVVEKEFIDLKFDELPELTDIELTKCKVTGNDIDRLGQISKIAKKKGLKMMFPCFKCDKVCLNFSALKLHKRRHEDNPKPFAPRVKNGLRVKKDKVKLDKSNRTALPKAIKTKHKCDKRLEDFFKSNIRGDNVEFWQFLKIFNKMDREKVNDFKDLEERSDFGNHLDYYKGDEDNDVNDSEDERLAREIDSYGQIDDESDSNEHIDEVVISDDD